MNEVLVVCGGLSPPSRGPKNLVVLDAGPMAPPAKRVNLKLDRLAKRLLDNLPGAIADLVEIAAYVYAADRLCRRDNEFMGGMGRKWRRSFRFRIPVRCPEIWSRPDVTQALRQTLSFLSDDDFIFVFSASGETVGLEPYFGFDQPEAQSFAPDEAVLFSGGLDSLAGAVEVLRSGKKLVLITHQSATVIASSQNALAEALASRFPGQTFYAPIWVTKGDQEPVEHTQRLRSFLFASLGFAVARMFKLGRLLFFENGITSFNLPLAEHVVGTRASRTTHPRVLKDLERLLSLILDEPFGVENGFLWRTKAEVVGSLVANKTADLINVTTSCARVRDVPMTGGRQCGVCSQCVERRFAILAAGVGDQETPDRYSVDLFDGPYSSGRQSAMAFHHILRANRLATMSEHTFLATYGQVFRAASSIPGPANSVVTKIHELHSRYGTQLVQVVDDQLQARATTKGVIGEPAGSLFSVIMAGGPQVYRDPGETEKPASIEAAQERRSPNQHPVIMALSHSEQRLILLGGEKLGRSSYKLVAMLAGQFEDDLKSGRTKEDHVFVSTRSLEIRLGWTDEQLRQQIRRTRESLVEKYLDGTGRLHSE